jgi:hypothetical protein
MELVQYQVCKGAKVAVIIEQCTQVVIGKDWHSVQSRRFCCGC